MHLLIGVILLAVVIVGVFYLVKKGAIGGDVTTAEKDVKLYSTEVEAFIKTEEAKVATDVKSDATKVDTDAKKVEATVVTDLKKL